MRLLAALLLAPALAAAAPLADQVGAQVRSTLPPSLALVGVTIPDGEPADGVPAVLWR